MAKLVAELLLMRAIVASNLSGVISLIMSTQYSVFDFFHFMTKSVASQPYRKDTSLKFFNEMRVKRNQCELFTIGLEFTTSNNVCHMLKKKKKGITDGSVLFLCLRIMTPS